MLPGADHRSSSSCPRVYHAVRTPTVDAGHWPRVSLDANAQEASQMQHMEIATRAGVPLADIESLWRGQATAAVASKLGVSMASVEDFIRGSANADMANRLGMTMNAAQELARTGGQRGAAGILLGLLLSVR